MKSVNLLPPDDPAEFVEEMTPRNPYKKALSFMGIIILLLLFLLTWCIYRLYKLADEQSPVATTPQPSKEVIAPKPVKVPEKPLPVQKTPPPPPPAPAKTPEAIPIAPPPEAPLPEPEEPQVAMVDKREYSLLVGTFTARETEKKFKEIKKLGLRPQKRKVKVKQKTYLVYVERVPTYAAAKQLEKKLKKDGFDTYLPPNQKDGFQVRTGLFSNRKYAKNMLNRLKNKGYKAKIETTQMPLVKYEIKIGKFETYQSAKAEQNNLQAKGIKTILLMKQVD